MFGQSLLTVWPQFVYSLCQCKFLFDFVIFRCVTLGQDSCCTVHVSLYWVALVYVVVYSVPRKLVVGAV